MNKIKIKNKKNARIAEPGPRTANSRFPNSNEMVKMQ